MTTPNPSPDALGADVHSPSNLSAQPAAAHGADAIAVVGMACRFPGAADSPRAFWDLLVRGEDATVEVPEDRWDVRRFFDPDPEKPGKMYVRRGGFLREPISLFDAMFFGISPREAVCLDPQQRVLLEVAWEAIEDAGLDPYGLAGSATGVYIGAFMLDNQLTQMGPLNRNAIGPHTALGSTMTILSNRLSFVFDFCGPSVSMDTACSSSLVAMHYACQGLRNNECSLALAGGVNIMHRPENPIAMCKGQFLSPDGRCKSFDERADGYGRGEGAGIIVLKRLDVAVQDGDRIYAIVRGTGVNQDGHTSAITVPNPEAQSTLIRRVCEQARIDPRKICYFEAHGTGTPVGDPIEAEALGTAIGQNRDPNAPCIVGSVKANIGHLEAASGVAGVIKACLCLQHKQIPPIANLGTPNPKIPFSQLGLRLPQTVEPMPNRHEPCLVGVNSFGYGGTNAHVLLEEAPAAPASESNKATEVDSRPFLLPLSARSEQALAELAGAYLQLLEKPQRPSLGDICYSASLRRGHHTHRLAFTAVDENEMIQQVRAFVDHGQAEHVTAGIALGSEPVRPVFVMTGMGPQWWAMGRQLFEREPVFRRVVESCDEIFRRLAGWSIQDAMLADQDHSQMADTVVAQPANFVLQAALTELWKSVGVQPAAVIGHSVGEVTGAYICGVLSLEDALRVSFHRSRIQKKAAGQGSMLALGTTEQHVLCLLAPYEGRVSIAAINSPSAITLAGDSEPLEEIAAQMESEGVFNRFLKVQVPYHSPAMDPLLDEIRQSLHTLRTNTPVLPLYSTVTGQRVEGPAYDAEYWCDNVRQPVRFAKALDRAIADGHDVFLEVGPHPVLSTSIKQCLASRSASGVVLTSLRRQEHEQRTFLDAMGGLYARGYRVDWQRLYPRGGRFVQLPSYPWQRQLYWQESKEATVDRVGEPSHPLLGHRLATPNPCWERVVNPQFLPYLKDHQVQGLTVLPGAAYVEAGLAICQQLGDQLAVALEDLRFDKALIVEDTDEPVLRCTYEPLTQEYTVHSRTRDDGANWSLHAKGKLASGRLDQPPPIDASSLRAEMGQQLDGTTHYRQMSSRGLQYGPPFQGVRRLWHSSEQVLAEIHSDEMSQGYLLHPAQLDACFQALLSILDADDTATYVPVRIGQVRWYASPTGPFLCHGQRLRCRNRTIEGDLTLFDNDGRVLAELRSVRAQALANKTRNHAQDLRQWLHTFAWEKADAVAGTTAIGKWLLWMDHRGIGEQLAEDLCNAGADEVIQVWPGTAFSQNDTGQFRVRPDSKEDLSQLLQTVGVDSCAGLVYLWGLDAPTYDEDVTATADVVAGLHVIQALANGAGSQVPRLVVVTRGAQPVRSGEEEPVLAQTPLVGLVRVAVNEYAEFRYQLVDLDPDLTVDTIPMLLQELLADSPEEEVALRGRYRYVHRLLQDPPGILDQPATEIEPVPATAGGQFQLDPVDIGSIDGLSFRQDQPRPPERGQVQIRIDAAAIDAKDVAKVTRALPPEALANTFSGNAIGVVVAGVVQNVGQGVRDLRPGQAIVACLRGGVRTSATVDASDVFTMPQLDHLNPEENAGLPLAFIPAYYGLGMHLGRLQPGQRVLIHVSGGGVGLAAIRLAQEAKAQVIATVADPAHRDQLRAMGIPDALDRNRLDWAEQAMAKTNGQYVDVVFNAAPRSVDAKDVSVLAAFGWLIHIATPGQTRQEDTTALLATDRNLNFSVVDIDRMMAERPDLFRHLLREVWQHQSTRQPEPLAVAAFPPAKIRQAFRVAQSRSHLGPVTVSLNDVRKLTLRPQVIESPRFKPDGTYLITGGFGGFGIAVAKWMASRGVRHLVLVGRRGAATDTAQAAVGELEQAGVTVKAVAADISENSQVKGLLEEVAATMPPLRGILHAAAVLDDGPINYLDRTRFENVMKPKAQGAWHLHRHSLDAPLDFFVLFSSIASQIGSPGQATYVAANTFLDALAHRRRAQGKPATSINWGALGEVGMAARHAEVKAYFNRVGIQSLSPSQAVYALDRILQADLAQISVASMDWHRWGQFNPAWAASPRFAHLMAKDQDGTKDSASSELRRQLAATEPQSRQAILVERLAEQVAKTLRLPPERVDPSHALTSLGVDSLMAMELQTAIAVIFGVEVSTLELMKGNNITQLAAHLLMKLDVDRPDTAGDHAPAHETSIASAQAAVGTGDAPMPRVNPQPTAQSRPDQLRLGDDSPTLDELEDLTDDQVDALLNAVMPSTEIEP